MLPKCPSCGYQRLESDDAPVWQCPACQIAYNKVGLDPAASVEAEPTGLDDSAGEQVADTGVKCPSCQYVRQESDDAPLWQCPKCEVAYAKVVETADPPAEPEPLITPPTAAPTRWPAYLLVLCVGAGAGYYFKQPTVVEFPQPIAAAPADTSPAPKASNLPTRTAQIAPTNSSADSGRVLTSPVQPKLPQVPYTGNPYPTVTSSDMFDVANRYYAGRGLPKNYALARYWYTRASELNHRAASRRLATMNARREGLGLPTQPTAAGRTQPSKVEKVEVTDRVDQFRRFIWLSEGQNGYRKNLRESQVWLERSADQGYTAAEYSMGWRYKNGIVVRKDLSAAHDWFIRAARGGHTSAQFEVAWAYAGGLGVAKDLGQAVRWYRQAAADGNTGAMNNLAVIFNTKRSGFFDESKAFNWYQKAALNGSDVAQGNLGRMYEFGQGVERDYVESMAWYIAARSNGADDLGDEVRRVERKMSAAQLSAAKSKSRYYISRY